MTDDQDVLQTPPAAEPLDDEAIRVLVGRLARPDRSGGTVVERASLLAAGMDFNAIIAWIEAHGGEPETAAPARTRGGLHSPRPAERAAPPLRFRLPPGALS